MNIGLLSVNNKPTSILAEGGTEVFTANLAEELIKRGNNVYLFGCNGSYVKGANNIPCTELSRMEIENVLKLHENVYLSSDELQALYYILCLRNISFAKKYENVIDIFHDNTSSPVIQSILDILKKPVVSSLHMPVDNLRKYPILYNNFNLSNVHFVSTSKYQQQRLGFFTKLIYNGIPLYKYINAKYKKKEHISWIGRIDNMANKGLDDAIIACTKIGKKLLYRSFVEDWNYFNRGIRPLLNNYCIHVESFKTENEKVRFYNEAKILVNPIKWEEPFGLTMIEAMASGTPVIAYARGAAPEIIRDGVTGFLVNSSDDEIRGDWIIKKSGIEGLIEAIQKLEQFSAKEYSTMCDNCRKIALKEYSIETMVDQYERFYNNILNKQC